MEINVCDRALQETNINNGLWQKNNNNDDNIDNDDDNDNDAINVF